MQEHGIHRALQTALKEATEAPQDKRWHEGMAAYRWQVEVARRSWLLPHEEVRRLARLWDNRELGV
jgi:hypothetical protein